MRSIRMMTSVSMLLRRIGAAIPVSVVKGFAMLMSESPHVGDRACDRGRHRHGRARQMGAGARTLAADEIAVGGRDRPLPRGHGFTVGGQAHRASRLAPFEAGVGEDPIEPLGDGTAL